MPDHPPYLMYVGPIRPGAGSGAKRIAELVASEASLSLDGTYRVTEMVKAKELANHDGAAVVNPDGNAILYVVNVPYFDELELDENGDPKSRGAAVKNLIKSIKFMSLAAFRLRHAWKGSQAKGVRAKWQLAIGMFFVVGLAAFVLLGAFALVLAIWPDVFPDWMESEEAGPRLGIAAFGGTITAGAVYAFAKGRVTVFGGVAQQVLNYVEEGQARKEVSSVLEQAIDRIDDLREEGQPPSKFHVLGYSFGSVLALDALCPPAGTDRGRKLAHVASLATVGCPADFVRLYYPDYFNDRTPLPRSVPWHNLFIANDVLGSNFLDSRASDGATSSVDGQADRPEHLLQPTVNFSFGSPDLGRMDLLKSEGFAMHRRYWMNDYKTSIIDVLMPLWPPMNETTAPVPQQDR